MRASHTHIDDFYQTDGTGVVFSRLVMPKKQFLFLLRVLRFNNVNTRDGRWELDQLAAIREIYDNFFDEYL